MSNQKSGNSPVKRPAAEVKAPLAKLPTAGGAAPISPGTKAVVPPLFRAIDWVAFAVTSVIVLIGYIYTLAPDMTLQDSGELATGSFYAGIPHPPGYPVWSVLSYFFTLLPISNVAYRASLLSAFSAALSSGFVALMISRGSSMFMEGIAELKNIERRRENAICMVAGFVGGLLIGFNGFLWAEGVIVEVYDLSVLSLAGVMLFLMRWIYAPHQHRYLYLAFFWFGICFNNHQSLLVIALGLEGAVIATQRKLGRDLLFWNVIIWLGGHVGRSMGLIGFLNDNAPLLLVYNAVGLASLVGWLWLVVKTKKTLLELARDAALLFCLLYVLVVFGTITSYATAFYVADSLKLKTGPFILCNLAGLAVIGAFVYLEIETRKMGNEWLQTLACGGTWALGALFYLYMPLAGMSNPPMEWGYPRTVQGFFHAFTRGQYERIHPTFGNSFMDDIYRFVGQVGMYCSMVLEEFNLVYVLIALLPFVFFWRMQKRERSWLIAVTGIYFCLGPFLLMLFNPALDKQSRDLHKVFFTAGHVMIAILAGYGLALLTAVLVVNYQRFRSWALAGFGVAAMIALYNVADAYWNTENPLVRKTAIWCLCLAIAATAIVALARERMPLKALLGLFCLLPTWSILSHWEDNEQRGHMFGYWFGHDMFTPPFPGPDGKLTYDRKLREEMTKKPGGKLIYPEMDPDTVIYGGTDPGRFAPTYMIFCESFIPDNKKPACDPTFDRRDCYLITQNALADGTYLNYIRAQYNKSDQVKYDTPFFQELLRGSREQAMDSRTNFIARLVIPLDHVFTDLGDAIEKSRRAGSSFFKETDFLDLPAFVAKLRPGPQQDALSQHIFANLSKPTQQMLTGTAEPKALKRALAADLNHLIEKELATKQSKARWYKLLDQKAALDRDLADTNIVDQAVIGKNRLEKQKVDQELSELMLYNAGRFAGVSLSDRTKRFIAENPRLHTRIRLNRLLLEEAYPNLIAKSKGGVYPDREILSATPEDSQRAFNEYLVDAQRRLDHDKRFPNEQRQIRPGEDVRMIENKVQVSGQVAVMAINAILTKIMFDKNPDHEFYVEESFPLDWMYPYLTPFGIIMKINRQPLKELNDDIVQRDHEFWSKYSERMIGNWITYDTPISNICTFAEQVYIRRDYENAHGYKSTARVMPEFIRDNDAQKAFSKLRSSIAGVYNYRFMDASSKLNAMQMRPAAEQQANAAEIQRLAAEQARMLREADFSFKQAFAFCPYSPEAVFRYITLLANLRHWDDCLFLAETAHKLDPDNGQITHLIDELKGLKKSQASLPPTPIQAPPPVVSATTDLGPLEAQVATAPNNFPQVYRLIESYLQQQQNAKAQELTDKLVANPQADANSMLFAAQVYSGLRNIAGIEKALAKLVKLAPDNPEAWFDLAGIQVLMNNQTQALVSLREALTRNAQRLDKDPKARNIYADATNDARFVALRQSPEFQKLLVDLKPSVK